MTASNHQEEYGRIVNGGEAVSAIDMGQFGESVDLSTGKTEFTATDVSLPGNSAIPVAFGRSRSIDNLGRAFNRGLGDWDIDLPYMEGVYVKGVSGQVAFPQGWIVNVPGQGLNRCSAPTTEQQVQPPSYGPLGNELTPKEFWQGIHLHAPGQGRQEVLFGGTTNPYPLDGRTYRYVTSGRWYLACDGLTTLPSGQSGDGFIARSPDGLIYHFNQMVVEDYAPITRPRISDAGNIGYDRERIRLYPSSVEDRYGNAVTYNWSAGKLTSIVADDGRTLTLTWNGAKGVNCAGSAPVLCRVSDGTRTWNYGYTLVYVGPYYRLSSVTLPDTSQWTLDFLSLITGFMDYVPTSSTPGSTVGYDTALTCNWMRTLASTNQRMISMTHPSGATATFGFGVKRHGRANVDFDCNQVGTDVRSHFPDIPGSTPLTRTLPRRPIMAKKGCHVQAKKVQRRVQA